MYGKQTLIKSLLVGLLAIQCSAYGDARTERLKELRKRPKIQPDRTTISKNEIAYSPGISTQPESHTPLLKGLVLVGNASDLNISGYENVQGVNAQYIDSIGSYQNLENEIVSYYLNKPLTNDNVTQIKNHISSYYQKNHRTKVTVSAPEQNLDSGVLQLVIIKEQMIQTRAEAPLRQQQPMRRSTPRMKQNPLQFDLFPSNHQQTETPKFQGLLLLEHMSDLIPYEYENLRGVNVINSTYQTGYRQLSKEVSPKYVDQPIDQDMIDAIKKGVVSYYEKAYSIQVNVAFPEQDIASGVIKLVVTQDKAIPAKSFETVAQTTPAAEAVAEETKKPFSSSVDKSFLAKASPVTGGYAAASEVGPYRYDTYTTNNVQTPRLRGLLLVSNEKELHLDGYELVQGLELVSVVMPGEPEHFQEIVTQRYINRPLTQETITDIKRTIIRYYQDLNRPVVTVVIPEQDVTAGVLQIIVIDGRVGRIYATGNKWFTEEQLVKHISLKPDQVIDSEVLDDDLFLLNRNPFRQVGLIYTPGAELGYTDLELLTYDRFPLRVYAGVDNTGNDLTGNNRIFAGINLGKIIATDQTLSYQYMTSSDFHRFKAHTIHYSAPLPWKHTLVLFGGYSRVTNEFHITPISTQRLKSHGCAAQASLRYDIPLDPHPNLLHEFTLGFDWKRTNNNLELGLAPIVSKRVNIGQFMASYNLGYEKNPFTFTFEIEGFGSPGQWIDDQKDEDFQSLRPFATAAYVYGRTSITFLWEFIYKASAQFYLRGQWANRNLLQSEEYGVGGYSTVRGYKERYINGDNAAVANFELRMPPFSILQLFGARNGRDELQFLGFFDFGWAAVNKTVTDQHKNHHIYSVGPGLRYLVAPFITLKVDWGFQLHEISKDDPLRDNRGGPSNRVHFSLVVGY